MPGSAVPSSLVPPRRPPSRRPCPAPPRLAGRRPVVPGPAPPAARPSPWSRLSGRAADRRRGRSPGGAVRSTGWSGRSVPGTATVTPAGHPDVVLRDPGVARGDRQLLGPGLPDEHAVEGVAVVEGRAARPHGVLRGDRQRLAPAVRAALGQIRGCVQPAEGPSDAGLPGRDGTDVGGRLRVGQLLDLVGELRGVDLVGPPDRSAPAPALRPARAFRQVAGGPASYAGTTRPVARVGHFALHAPEGATSPGPPPDHGRKSS